MKKSLWLSWAFLVTPLCSAETESLANYTPLLTEQFNQLLKQADLSAGQQLFERKCQTCHDNSPVGQHNTGPNLWQVVGRPAGRAAGFNYSQAMSAANHSWNPATLNHFLTNTKKAIPGTKMTFRKLRKEQDRANLIGYLLNDTQAAAK